MELKKQKSIGRQAFTLVELLIVMGILVMLAAIVGPNVLRSGKKANIKMATTQIAGFKEVLQMYYMDMKTFPLTEQGLKALYERPDDLDENNNWGGPYEENEREPLDPFGEKYQYEYPPTHSKRDFPDIWSFGPDGQDGTADDICNWRKKSGTGESEDGEFDMSELDDMGDMGDTGDMGSGEVDMSDGSGEGGF